jgi:hypothetical protein
MNTTTIDLAPLQAHLNAIKTKVQAWVAEDPKNRWACYPVNEAEFWAKQGITTVEQFDHYELVSQVFEMTREIFDYKPHWGNLNAASDEFLRSEIEFLNDYAKSKREAEQAEKRAHEAATVAAMTHKSGFSIGELIPL